MSDKVTKESVDYRRISPRAIKRCGVCSMFREPNNCTLVEGLIEPKRHVCDRFDWKV